MIYSSTIKQIDKIPIRNITPSPTQPIPARPNFIGLVIEKSEKKVGTTKKKLEAIANSNLTHSLSLFLSF
jgi:hypothetical protein